MKTTGKIKVTKLEVKGVATHYTAKRWVDDRRYKDGGYFKSEEARLSRPKVIVHFAGETEEQLMEGGVYTDGANEFIAISKHEIVNYSNYVDTFSMPDEAVLVYLQIREE